MNTPLISVVIPVYNIEHYLERCVNSVREQTYGNLEILLVDDGSTDRSGAICDKLAEHDARIRVFHKENGGSSSARNLGITMARGAYLGFVDSDDYISCDMYELLYNALVEQDAFIAQIGRDEVDEQGNQLPNICEPPAGEVFIESEAFFKELLMHRGDCSFCTKLFDKRLLEQRQFPVGELNEDFKLLMHLLCEVKGIVSLPKQGYHVFYRIGSNTRKADKQAFSRVFADSVNNADLAQELVEKAYPGLAEVAFRFGIFQRLEYLLHVPIGQMTGENSQYVQICRHLKRNWLRIMRNSCLTGKNKVYATLFAIAPKGIRVLHKRIRKL